MGVRMNGWNWIEEGQRIKEQAREIAGLTEEVMAESIVFNHQMIYEGELDSLKAAAASRPARPCREDGFCDAVYRENDRGGEAREIVGLLAKVVGVNLGASHEGPRPLDGNVWSPRNMMRVVQAVQEVLGEHESLRKELHDRDKKDDRTVAALREALIHAGEAV
ncbi:hypothetical protein ELB20_56 [Streptomyces phage phiELB20]|uniref:Uncharacterized protein n=2 Tax=Arequatrovirus TaxID=1982881 RepID=I7B7P7_9CAUD|nr:hypothetical protein FDG59_gp28 [Streptomyces phage phiELB20]AFO10922.1 hypothetical protein ELB20_56 [Streptomyces phage phiELB20]